MATSKKARGDDSTTGSQEEGRIQGRISLEGVDGVPDGLNLKFYLFGRGGQLLGMADVNDRGEYDAFIKIEPEIAGDIVVAPGVDLDLVQKSAVFRASISKSDLGDKPPYQLRKNFYIPKYIWYPWLPVTICVSGRVRKLTEQGACPVPFAKVEIYDVDRENCWWPPILKWWPDLINKVAVRAVDLLKEPPFPPVGPGPVEGMAAKAGMARLNPQPEVSGAKVALNPQPLPPRDWAAVNPQPLPPRDWAMLNPQPLPPREGLAASNFSLRNVDIKAFDPQPEPPAPVLRKYQSASQFASPLSDLVISSKIAPWLIFPGCFYSKALVCETTTDCDGEFECCYTWFPWHFRRGRLRFDYRPDILVKVTQVIGGSETVIYLDPYSSTRWNVSSAYLDLLVDDDEIVCGSGCHPHPAGTGVFFTLVGLDEVYKIDQVTGKFSNLAYGGSYANWAYGGWLLACGLFGMGLSNGSFYYRLSYQKGGGAFTPITYPLSDTRVDKVTLISDIHTLGPVTVNGTPNLFEIRDALNYYWYNPDKIGWMDSESIEVDSGLYTMRLEVFDSNGVFQTSATVNYLDGTVPPPGPLPPMLNHCDLKLLVDNRYPSLDLDVTGASGECGVVPCANRGSLALDVFVNQVHGRLWYWYLSYVKGLNAASGTLDSDIDYQGISPLPVNKTLSGMAVAPLLSSSGTCAYALTLGAWPLVRNGFGVIHYTNLTQAIAIEGC